MNRRFLAVCLWVLAALFLAFGAGDVRTAVRDRKPAAAAWVVLLAVAGLAAVLANAGTDLW